MVGMIFICKSIPIAITECFLSYKSVLDTLEEPSSCTSSSTGWPKSIPCLLASYRIGVREAVLSFMTYSGIERKSIVYMMNF